MLRSSAQLPAGMLGEDESTKFSPWLSMGCLSPRTVHHELKKYEGQRTANKSTCGHAPCPCTPWHATLDFSCLAVHTAFSAPCRAVSDTQICNSFCSTYSMHSLRWRIASCQVCWGICLQVLGGIRADMARLLQVLYPAARPCAAAGSSVQLPGTF